MRCLPCQAKHIDEHEKLECPRADTPCGNRCGEYVPLGDMESHYADSCAHRFVPCGLGCGYRVRAKVTLCLCICYRVKTDRTALLLFIIDVSLLLFIIDVSCLGLNRCGPRRAESELRLIFNVKTPTTACIRHRYHGESDQS